jgi:hypothetical protein
MTERKENKFLLLLVPEDALNLKEMPASLPGHYQKAFLITEYV